MEKTKDAADTGQPVGNYAAYKKELQEALATMPVVGASMRHLIAGLRKKYGLNTEDGTNRVVDPAPLQGNWSLQELRERHAKAQAQEAEEKAVKQKEADNKKRLKDLRARFIKAQFQKPASFTWPEEARDVLRPFELAKDREIWAAFSFLKLLLREALASEFNLPGVEVNLVKFMDDANNYPGGEKQLLTDALSALKSLLRIMLSKQSEPVKSVVMVKPASVAPLEAASELVLFRLKESEINFQTLAEAMWNSKAKDKAWQELRQDFSLLESREVLAGVLPHLNKEQAQILFLRYEKGLSWEQIGQALGIKRQYAYGYFFRAIETIATFLRRLKVDFPSRAIRARVPAKPEPAKAKKENKRKPFAERKRLRKENEKEAGEALSQANLAKIKKLLWPEGRFLESSQQLAPFFIRPWRRGKLKSTLEEKIFFLLVGEEDLGGTQIAQKLGRDVNVVYCAKSLFLRKLKAFCSDLRKSLGLFGEPPDKKAQEAWVETVLAAELKDLSEIFSLLRQISLSRLQEAIGPDGSVFKQPEQLVLLLLQPGKHGLTLTSAQTKIFLLSYWQERIQAHKIEARGGPSTKMVHSMRHVALRKIKALARQIAESGISAGEFLKKALAPPVPKISKAKLRIALAQLGNYLVLMGLHFLSLSSEQGEKPETESKMLVFSKEPVAKPVEEEPAKNAESALLQFFL